MKNIGLVSEIPMNTTLNFAFVDLETTGFSPRKGDRIVEIAIVTTDWQGNILDRFESLVNPLREVTGTEIHQLTAEMLSHAPTFSEIAEDLLFYLKDKIIIGHNLSFDLGFLETELRRTFEKQFLLQGMCTLQLSKALFPSLPIRRLEALCEFLDVDLSHAHSAFGDCEATVSLFFRMRSLVAGQNDFDWDQFLMPPFCVDFELLPLGVSINRSQAEEKSNYKKSRLQNFIKRLPVNPSEEVPVLQYLNLLDEVLADRLLTDSEFQSLEEMILSSRFSQRQVASVHNEYLRNLCRVYLIDHHLSRAEYSDLKWLQGYWESMSLFWSLLLQRKRKDWLKSACWICLTGTL